MFWKFVGAGVVIWDAEPFQNTHARNNSNNNKINTIVLYLRRMPPVPLHFASHQSTHSFDQSIHKLRPRVVHQPAALRPLCLCHTPPVASFLFFAQAKVVRLVTVGLSAVHLAEKLWLDLIHALKERRYSSAVRHLRDAKRHIAEAKRR